MLYDWANSAFYTTVISVMLGPYLISIAESSVGKEGLIFDLGLIPRHNRRLSRFLPRDLGCLDGDLSSISWGGCGLYAPEEAS